MKKENQEIKTMWPRIGRKFEPVVEPDSRLFQKCSEENNCEPGIAFNCGDCPYKK